MFRELPGTGRHPDHYRPLALTLAPGVAPAWQSYRRAVGYDLLTPELDARLWNAYCHLPLQLVKVATLLAALDWVAALPPTRPRPPAPWPPSCSASSSPRRCPCPPNRPSHPPPYPHLARAQLIVEGWRASTSTAP